MGRLFSLGLAMIIAAGPTSPAWASGRAVALGSMGKTVAVTAIPATFGAQTGLLSFNSVGPLGIQSSLPNLTQANVGALNAADPTLATTARKANNPKSHPAGIKVAVPIHLIIRGRTPHARIPSPHIITKKAPGRSDLALFGPAANRLDTVSTTELSPHIWSATFDGSGNRADLQSSDQPVETKTTAGPAKKRRSLIRGIITLLTTPLRLPKFKKKPKIDTDYTKDDWGGYKALKPKALPAEASKWRKFRAAVGLHVGYGLKWGFNLFAIGTILDTVVAPLITGLPWQLLFSEAALHTIGRTELLTSMGAMQIASGMAMSPLAFLALALPVAVVMEELRFRLMSFGGWFLGTALIRPFASKLSSVLATLPDASGLRGTLQFILNRIGNISKHSFVIGAVASSIGFASAHIALWGFHPTLLLYHAVMGYALAHIAYRSRFVLAPFIAHYTVNALMIALATIVPVYLGVQTAAIASTVLGLLSVIGLYYNWRTWTKRKNEAAQEARGETENAKTRPARHRRWYSRIASLSVIPILVLVGVMSFTPNKIDTDHTVKGAYVRMVSDEEQRHPIIKVPENQTPGAEFGIDLPGHGNIIQNLLQQMVNPAAVTPAGPELSTIEIVRKNKPAVVNVLTEAGTGTGFIINHDGTLITNAHVIATSVNQATGKISREHRTEIMIRLANGNRIPAKVIAFNPDKDIAMLRITRTNPFGWPTVTIGNSNTLQEGQDIVVMGYPLGQPFTVTKGIVSGLGHRGNGFIKFQQHDAAVNPGNSGGPLFNMQGEVVGINTQIVSPVGAFVGISRSITSQDLQNALAQYKATGNISSPWLGAIFYPQDPAMDGFGAKIEAVRPDGPAAKAGLLSGDIIVGIDGRPLAPNSLHAFSAISSVMRTKAPTDTLTLQVDRDGTVIDVVVTLGAH